MTTRFKFRLSILAILLFANSFHAVASQPEKDTDPEKDKVLIYVLKNILTRGHFVEKDLNDNFSEVVYNSFIEGLDPSKRYFTPRRFKRILSI